MKTKICPTCGKEFKAQWSGRQFCSRHCYGVSISNPPKICPTCNKPFHKLERPDAVYCSRECFEQSKRPYVTLICLQCGKSFSVISSQSHHKFCSPECFYASAPQKRIRITVDCEECGKPVQKKPYALGRQRHVYCSRKCQASAASRLQLGARNPNYKGGTLFPFRGDNWSSQRRKALRRDGYKCQICGRRLAHKAWDHGVHHIVPYKLFNGDFHAANALLNLISLCRDCHIAVEHHSFPCPQPLL